MKVILLIVSVLASALGLSVSHEGGLPDWAYCQLNDEKYLCINMYNKVIGEITLSSSNLAYSDSNSNLQVFCMKQLFSSAWSCYDGDGKLTYNVSGNPGKHESSTLYSVNQGQANYHLDFWGPNGIELKKL